MLPRTERLRHYEVQSGEVYFQNHFQNVLKVHCHSKKHQGKSKTDINNPQFKIDVLILIQNVNILDQEP